ncbi:hypothetical protein [Geodermatophilus sp. SYSU D00710]
MLRSGNPRARLRAAGDGLTGIRLQLVAAAIDLGLLADVVDCVPVGERVELLRAVARLLAPGGALVVVTSVAGPQLFSRHLRPREDQDRRTHASPGLPRDHWRSSSRDLPLTPSGRTCGGPGTQVPGPPARRGGRSSA